MHARVARSSGRSPGAGGRRQGFVRCAYLRGACASTAGRRREAEVAVGVCLGADLGFVRRLGAGRERGGGLARGGLARTCCVQVRACRGARPLSGGRDRMLEPPQAPCLAPAAWDMRVRPESGPARPQIALPTCSRVSVYVCARVRARARACGSLRACSSGGGCGSASGSGGGGGGGVGGDSISGSSDVTLYAESKVASGSRTRTSGAQSIENRLPVH